MFHDFAHSVAFKEKVYKSHASPHELTRVLVTWPLTKKGNVTTKATECLTPRSKVADSTTDFTKFRCLQAIGF